MILVHFLLRTDLKLLNCKTDLFFVFICLLNQGSTVQRKLNSGTPPSQRLTVQFLEHAISQRGSPWDYKRAICCTRSLK